MCERQGEGLWAKGFGQSQANSKTHKGVMVMEAPAPQAALNWVLAELLAALLPLCRWRLF